MPPPRSKAEKKRHSPGARGRFLLIRKAGRGIISPMKIKATICAFAIASATVFIPGALAKGLSERASVGGAETSAKDWNGFRLESFPFEGRAAILISPQKPRADKAWIVRPAWYGAFANADHELLKRGFHVAFIDLSYTCASEEALSLMDRFHKEMTKGRGLNKRVALEGMSRGGLTALMWADRDPSKVSCVYADNAVCDSASIGENFSREIMAEWGIDSMENFRGSPIYNYRKLAKSRVPVLFVAAGMDEAVPFEKNGRVYVENFEKAGGNIEFIFKPEGKHHPHGFDDPSKVAEFVEKAQDAAK